MFLRLHDANSNICVINTDNIAMLTEDEHKKTPTKIVFPGDEINYVLVQETIPEIFAKIGIARLNS